MLLAAGRGERMRPLTDQLPKPLLLVRGKPLIVYHLERLARVGVREVVINLAWLGEQIRAALGDGAPLGPAIHYSDEGARGARDRRRHLPGAALARHASRSWSSMRDVFTDFDFGTLQIAPEALAQLVLVPNPPHHPEGDFALDGSRVLEQGAPRWTYAGIGLFRPGAVRRLCSPGASRCCRCCSGRSRRGGCTGSCTGALERRRHGRAPGGPAVTAGEARRHPAGDRATCGRIPAADRLMSTLKGIPILSAAPAVRSGEKYLTPQGFTAIKDGIKARGEPDRSAACSGKPRWLRAPLPAGAGYDFVRRTVREHRLATVCEEAKCPNIGECWNAGTATHHADGRGVHARLPLLRGRYRQSARLARCR